MDISLNPEVEKFLESLEIKTGAKVTRVIGLLETFGHNITLPHSKKLTADLFELRVRGHLEVRIFYAFHKGVAHLLHAFIKKIQKIPVNELHIALTRFKLLT